MPGPVALSHKDFNQTKGVNLAPGQSATDVAQLGQAQSLAAAAEANAKGYTDAQLVGLASGQTPKGTVRAATTTNVNITSPGSTIDGLTPAAGDIFLLTGQTTGSQNGPYRWNGASTAMTRASNWDEQSEAVLGSYWIVREGSLQDTFALLTNDAFTLGTTTATFKFVGIAAAVVADGYTELCPVVNAAGTWTITHGLTLTCPPIVQVYRVASPYDLMDVAVRVPSTSQVQIAPDLALAAGEFRAVIKRVA